MDCDFACDGPGWIDYQSNGHRLHVRGNGPALREMLIDMIDSAKASLRLHYYIFASDRSGRLVLARLIRAARRGVDVMLMLDSFGSSGTPRAFFRGLERCGGRIGWFQSSWSTRSLIRNHQKIAIADHASAIIGGFNVSDGYFGLPEDDCWHDMGLCISGPQVEELVTWYDQLWHWVCESKPKFRTLRIMIKRWRPGQGAIRWLVGGPTTRLSPWARTVRYDLDRAREVQIVAAYFSPGNGLLRRLKRIARDGVARLIVASRSDNTATVAAARLLYGPLLRAGVEIYEYLPCRLHMKLVVIDNAVYIGSANFDMRSLYLNLEIMLRIEDADFAALIRSFVAQRVSDSLPITREIHSARRTPFRLLKGWISYFLVGVLDYKITRRLNFRD